MVLRGRLPLALARALLLLRCCESGGERVEEVGSAVGCWVMGGVEGDEAEEAEESIWLSPSWSAMVGSFVGEMGEEVASV